MAYNENNFDKAQLFFKNSLDIPLDHKLAFFKKPDGNRSNWGIRYTRCFIASSDEMLLKYNFQPLLFNEQLKQSPSVFINIDLERQYGFELTDADISELTFDISPKLFSIYLYNKYKSTQIFMDLTIITDDSISVYFKLSNTDIKTWLTNLILELFIFLRDVKRKSKLEYDNQICIAMGFLKELVLNDRNWET